MDFQLRRFGSAGQFKEKLRLYFSIETICLGLWLLLFFVSAWIFTTHFSVSSINALSNNPSSPWAGAILVNAWRLAHGIPVLSPNYATHMYGPLMEWIASFFVRWFGPCHVFMKFLTLFSGVYVFASLSRILTRGSPKIFFWGIFFFLWVINSRTGFYLSEARPDWLALSLSLTALIFAFKAFEANNTLYFLSAEFFFIASFLAKQPMAIATLIPPVALLLSDRFRGNKFSCFTIAPLTSVILTAVLIRVISPLLFHFMFKLPSSYPIKLSSLRIVCGNFLQDIWPLVLLSVLFSAFKPHECRLDKFRTWALASVLVLVPTSLIIASKDGATSNSVLPAYLSLYFWTILKTLSFFQDARHSQNSFWRISATFLVVIFVFWREAMPLFQMNIFHIPKGYARRIVYWPVGIQDKVQIDYQSTIDFIRQHPNNSFSSPEDPSILVFADRNPGKNIYLEADNLFWNWLEFLKTIELEITASDFVVNTPLWFNYVYDSYLYEHNFVPLDERELSKSIQVWRKKQPGENTPKNDAPNFMWRPSLRYP